MSEEKDNSKTDFLIGGGVMGEHIRRFDWSQTPLGAIETWGQSLKTAVSVALNSRFSMFVWWGEELIYLYNDAYAPTLGPKHPEALGKSARQVWAEIWDDIRPQVEAVFGRGEASWNEELLLFLERKGFAEETYHTFSYSPIVGEDNRVSGLFCAVSEETPRVLSRRRLQTLRDLGERTLEESQNAENACRAAIDVLRENPYDVSFAVVYLLDEEGKRAHLSESVRFEREKYRCPETIDLENAATDVWNFRDVLANGKNHLIDNLEESFGAVYAGAWENDQTHKAFVLPLAKRGAQDEPAGFLVCGISPRLEFDDDYRGFLDLVAGHLASAIANARAREQERRRAEALAEIDRAKTEFFSNVSHEFRTPLTLMLGSLEEVLDKNGAIPRDQRQSLETAQRNSLRLLKLVNNLLDFSRVEANRTQASFEPTDLSQLTSELAGNFQSAVERAQIKFTVDCESISENIFVDREMWEKIVLNLISNAFKFTFEGEIKVVLRETVNSVIFTVEDTGTGIAESELPRIFERFHRIQGAQSRTHEGTGIGLSLVAELVKIHGGKISAASEIDRGSTFTIEIPKGFSHLPSDKIGVGQSGVSENKRAAAFLNEIASMEALGGSTSHSITADYANAPPGKIASVSPNVNGNAAKKSPLVLLADDNADMRAYLRRLLEESGCRVAAVSDGERALEFLEKNADELPELILSDVMMPNLDGFELLEKVRADENLRDTSMILLSARAGEEARIEGLVAGADDYLTKPFAAKELLARVESNLKLTRQRRENRRQITEILESISDAFFAIDRSWRFTYLNQQAEQLLSRKADNLKGKNVWEEFPGLLGTDFEKHYRTAMNDQIAGTITGFYPDHERFYEVNYFPAENGLTVFFRDITERRLADQALEISRLHLDSAIMAGRMGTWRIDLKNEELISSDTCKAIFGRAPNEDFTYQDLAATVLDEDRPRWRATVGRAINNAESFEIEYRIRRPDDSIGWVLVRGNATTDETGKTASLSGVSLDVSERRQVEAQLQESQKLIADVLNSITAHISVLDKTGTITLVNQAWRNFALENGADPLAGNVDIGTNYLEVCGAATGEDAEDAAAISKGLREILNGERDFFSLEYPCHAPNCQRWFLLTAAPLTHETGGAVVSHQNITERKLAEQERERLLESEQAARVEAERANRLKDEFLATVSHELRTPLNAILGWSSMLQSGKLTTEMRARAEETIYRSAKSQAQLIEDLLDVSRIITGKLKLSFEPVDLETIVRSAVETLRPAIDAKNIRLDVQAEDNAKIAGDANRLQQIIWNLVSNATKFTPENGSINIRVERAESSVRLIVTDTGEGIGAEDLPYIFERFRQADGSSTRKYGGLGLGLAIVRHLVEIHGGTIFADSAGLGHGATFETRFPLLDSSPLAPPATSNELNSAAENLSVTAEEFDGKTNSEYAPLKNLRVLAVDDESAMLELVELSLASNGAKVTICESAEAALEILQNGKFDLLISDIAMPEKDGYWLIEQVRALPAAQGGAISAIALTAYARTEDGAKILAAGFQLFLPKPIEPSDLARRVFELTTASI